MARILAIDYGTKRVGVAVTDNLQIIASPLETIHRKDIMKFLEDYLSKENVKTIVVGDPRMVGMDGTIAKQADEFCKQLKKKFPDINIERISEFFTSKIAQQTIIKSGISKKARREKSLIDKISASIILQDFLNSQEILNPKS